MSEIGARLKQARESRGLSLRQVAATTKIAPVALEAIERGEVSRLPGGIFSRAFVRAYAAEVGLDQEEALAQFLVELRAHEGRVREEQAPPEVTADDRAFLEQQRKAAIGLRIAVVILVVLIIATVMAWRVRIGPGAQTGTDLAPAPAVTTAAPVGEPAPAAEPVVTQGPALSITLTAADSCWVQVTVDGDRRLGRMFAAGDREEFAADRDIVLQVGNAGAVTLLINGRPARALGRVGEVRTVTISSENAAQFYQAPDAPPTPTASATDRP